MGYLKKYRVNFRELDLGHHRFSFEIDDRFFSWFEKSEIQQGSLTAAVELIKEERLTTLHVKLLGEVSVRCDRCLDYFMHPVEFTGTLYVKPEEDEWEEKGKEEVILVSPDQSEVDLAQYFYESIHLSLPLKRVHPDDENGNSTCDQDMLKLLEAHQREEQNETDPRWDKLKNLFVKRN
ncbi:MAG: DUF177 domain-containing protein [Bacteroidales bacterium]|nr:DUF177 domain-containing protein [Bacteroidales bacterium]